MKNKSILFVIILLSIAAIAILSKLLFFTKHEEKFYEIMAKEEAKKIADLRQTAKKWGVKTEETTKSYNQNYKEEFEKLKKDYEKFEEDYQKAREKISSKSPIAPTSSDKTTTPSDKTTTPSDQITKSYDATTKDPLCQVSGGIEYLMTFDEIANATKEKFSKLQKNGLIITEQEHINNKSKYTYLWDDLTRIWGSDFLNHKISQEELKEFAIPDFIMVSDNPKNIKVSIEFDDDYPTIKKVTGAKIFFISLDAEKLSPEENEDVVAKLSKLHYKNFEPGNIIKSKEKPVKYYIVSISKKSFIGKEGTTANPFNNYIKRRFIYFNKNKIIPNNNFGTMEIYPFAIETPEKPK